jgi:glycine cleavage system H protein
METPGELYFAPSHEWVRIEDDGSLTVGISDFAQQELGDLVFVETPEIDAVVEAEQGIAVVESVKAASDLYAPVSGTILDTNTALAESPELVNTDPYGEGWIFKMTNVEASEVLDALMSADDYDARVTEDT